MPTALGSRFEPLVARARPSQEIAIMTLVQASPVRSLLVIVKCFKVLFPRHLTFVFPTFCYQTAFFVLAPLVWLMFPRPFIE